MPPTTCCTPLRTSSGRCPVCRDRQIPDLSEIDPYTCLSPPTSRTQEVAACHVSRMLETPPCMLRSLDLSHCGMGDEGAYVLRGALMGHPTMRSLDLSRNRIGITGAQVRGRASRSSFLA